MGFLRRLLGDREPNDEPVAGAEADPGPAGGEQARDRELLLEDARRLDDDLLQRQLRYADRAWTPPPQGGPRRADHTEGDTDGASRQAR
jgi:hypothetical protein